jgi:hypothetical protein
MYNFTRNSNDEIKKVFSEAAKNKKIADSLIEKDFWVTVILSLLFEETSFKDHILFKGGTSLSKSFNLINRFSEDIDIILDWRQLGITDEEAFKERSNTQQDKFNKHVDSLGAEYIKNTILSELKSVIKENLTDDLKVFIEDDPHIICIEYTKSFKDEYLLPIVKLEIGPRASRVPFIDKEVSAYIIEHYPTLFEKKSCLVKTITAERTFWEKITIFHSVAMSGKCPPRYSRHYYDVYKFLKSDIMTSVLSDLYLLEQVVEFTKKFYISGKGNYDTAKLGSLSLVPSSDNLKKLKDDYQRMKNMLFGDIPEFDTIIKSISEFESNLNKK